MQHCNVPKTNDQGCSNNTRELFLITIDFLTFICYVCVSNQGFCHISVAVI